MNDRSKILILYDWFYPGYRAGGPIQSLTNLAVALMPDFDIYVITTPYDLNCSEAYEGVEMNSWNDVHLPGAELPVKVFYAERKILNKETLGELVNQIGPEIIHLNGLFSYRFFLLPLQLLKGLNKKPTLVISPRGMLKKAALLQKPLKKRLYFSYLKLTGLLKPARWHATTPEEADEIAKFFPSNNGIWVAPNIPKSPWISISPVKKRKGELRLVYLSLINEHKNLLLLLRVIKQIDAEIKLDVYGPLVDENYWQECQSVMKEIPGKVQYQGEVRPGEVQELLSKYHGLILLTKGENFSHAIYEALSVGRPVITSAFTPWQNLAENRAGANVNIHDVKDCIKHIDGFVQMDQDEFNKFCFHAHSIALSYYKDLKANEKYNQLFLMT